MMIHFNYEVTHTTFIPETITVKGEQIKADAEEYAFTNDEGKYFPPSVEYGKEWTDDKGEDHSWTIRLEVYKTGIFHINLSVDWNKVAEDRFDPDDQPVSLMLDRFVETLEGYIG